MLLVVALPLAWWIASAGRGGLWCRLWWRCPGVAAYGAWVLSAGGAGAADGAGAVDYALLGHPLAFTFAGLWLGRCSTACHLRCSRWWPDFVRWIRRCWRRRRRWGRRRAKCSDDYAAVGAASLLTSAVLAFTHTVGEFGVVLMLGGNIPGATRTLSISLYDQVQDSTMPRRTGRRCCSSRLRWLRCW